jgi:hypothetical protein
LLTLLPIASKDICINEISSTVLRYSEHPRW